MALSTRSPALPTAPPHPWTDSGIQVPAVVLITALVTGAVPSLALAIVAVRGGIENNPWILPLGLATLVVNTLIVFMDLRYGLAMFILAAGVSPELAGNLRVEDFIFVLVFGVWLLKNIQQGRLPTIRSPIVLPFLLVTVMSMLSTVWGITIGQVPDPKYSIFLQLKRVEYFLIFWVVATSVRTETWLRLLTVVFVLSGALAAVYGMATPTDEVSITISDQRVMGPEGENYNTLSGYLVICIGLGLAAFAGFRRTVPRLLLLGSSAVAAMGLLFSFSREGLIMLMGSVLVFGFTRYRKVLVLAGAALTVVLVVPGPIQDNFAETLHLIQVSRTDDAGANSLTARYYAWEYRFRGWFLKQPILGNGVGSVALSVDNEYLLRACETGIIGFGFFLWWLAAIGAEVKRLQRLPGLTRTIGLGLAAAFVGLLIQGLVAASFTTIRTMEPFWFLLGLATSAYLIQKQRVREIELAGAAE